MELHTKIGLEIHVQLKTKSKMFCGCDNSAEGKAPNSVVCPVCLGLPGALPVANKQAIEWTVKTGLALNCEIPKIAKFDRKHYFYPDLPKGYQISQYDEPFCVGGFVEVSDVISNDSEKSHEISRLDGSMARNDKRRIRLNRIHLEEDAGKLIHKDGKSLVDLNRAGTPLMEIVTEPDITTAKMAGDFLRKLQKIVRDQVEVSLADMEKGHLRCDANISVSEIERSSLAEATEDVEPKVLRMSPIVEIKNINSFRFVEKALALVEQKLKDEYGEWPEGRAKETWGYDSVNNKVYLQRRKEEAADYRYFPEPDLPPFSMTKFDLESIRSGISKSLEENVEGLKSLGIAEAEAKILQNDKAKKEFFEKLSFDLDDSLKALAAKAIVHNYFSFKADQSDFAKIEEYKKALTALAENKVSKGQFSGLVLGLHNGEYDFESFMKKFTPDNKGELVVATVVETFPAEIARYRTGEKQLFGFFMGQVMKATGNSANPQEISKILKEKLENK